MGVYIKGMEKPSDCQYCVMYRDGYCGAKGGFCRSEKGVDADCPIVEVVEVNESEIPTSSEKPNNCKVKNYCDDCLYNDVCDDKEFFYACTSKSTRSKMEQVDKDTNVRSKDCETCKHDLWHTPRMCGKCVRQEDGKPSMYEPKTEPQKCYLRKSCDHYGDKQVCGRCRHYNLYSHTKTEPQTDCETCLYAGECDWKQWQKCYSQSVRSNLEPFRVAEREDE